MGKRNDVKTFFMLKILKAQFKSLDKIIQKLIIFSFPLQAYFH